MSRLRTKLFQGEPSLPQQAIVGFWGVNLALVLGLWLTTTEFSGGTAILLDALAMLFGLLATFFALTQFMLMGRINWIERHFGLDHLASYHRINGYLAFSCILVHPIFVTISYAMERHINLWQQYLDLIFHYDYVWLAFIAQILFIFVVGSSIYIARKRLKFETWYFVHLAVYAAIIIVPLHQLAVGDSFVGDEHPLAKLYWLSLYAFVALNILIWRLGLPLFNFWRFRFQVDKVVAETPTTTSVYIHGRNLSRLKTIPGQFILVRIFAKGFWWQEHPFSLAMIPHDNILRLTIRHVGDYTNAIAKLKPGKYVLVSGPFGRFTREIAQTNKRLFVAGGVGITPIRSLIEEALAQKLDCALIYGNKSPDDIVFRSELDGLAKKGLKITHVFSDAPRSYRGEIGYVDAGRIAQLAPDFAERDIYLCGPPPMMAGIIDGLSAGGEVPANLHYERFALHN
jgi:predicted ferric reductase